MPDILTGEEELEIAEAIDALKAAKLRLNPNDPDDQAGIVSLENRIELLSQTIEDEVPTPHLCPACTPRNELPELKCPRSGHKLGEDGFALVRPAYLPLGQTA